jgi:hypothetical protein
MKMFSGDCCTPKFRLFVKDINNMVVEKMFDFTDGNIFSTILPEVKHKKTNIQDRHTVCDSRVKLLLFCEHSFNNVLIYKV